MSAAFSTAANARGKDFRVAFVGDPQVDDSLELAYARRTIYRELRESRGIDLAIIMGDIVNNNPSLLAPGKASLDSLPFPYLCIPGNHDDISAFRQVFGYTDTTFTLSRKALRWKISGSGASEGIRFILLNDNRDRKNSGLSREQKSKLSKILRSTPQEQTVVLATHVPLKYCSGRDSIMNIISTHPNTLLVSAHLHQVFRTDVPAGNGVAVHEIGVGATCGSWWRGVEEPVLIRDGKPSEKRGTVPNARMNCGAPRGYFIVDFAPNGSYRTRYKAVGRDASQQFSLRRDGDSIFVNVYGGHTGGEVELSVKDKDGKEIRLQCRRSATTAPEVRDIISYNDSFTRAERKKRRRDFIPMRRLASPHLWSCAVPEGMETGRETKVTVIYHDPWMSFIRSVPIGCPSTDDFSRNQ